MELRVKDICKEKGLLLKDLAERLGVTDVGLRKQIQGNPTIETLQKIAEALQVDFVELFINEGITGFIKANGTINEINSIEDIKKLLTQIEENK